MLCQSRSMFKEVATRQWARRTSARIHRVAAGTSEKRDISSSSTHRSHFVYNSPSLSSGSTRAHARDSCHQVLWLDYAGLWRAFIHVYIFLYIQTARPPSLCCTSNDELRVHMISPAGKVQCSYFSQNICSRVCALRHFPRALFQAHFKLRYLNISWDAPWPIKIRTIGTEICNIQNMNLNLLDKCYFYPKYR